MQHQKFTTRLLYSLVLFYDVLCCRLELVLKLMPSVMMGSRNARSSWFCN